MVGLFRKTAAEPVLDDRIASLARRRGGLGAGPDDAAPGEASPVAEVATQAAPGMPRPAPEPAAEPPPPPVRRPPPASLGARVSLASSESTAAALVEPAAATPMLAAGSTPAAALAPEFAPERPRPSFFERPAQSPTLTPSGNSGSSPLEEKLAGAREQLVARLGNEIRPERRSLLSRGELAKLVDAAVQAYFVRGAINADPLARRDLVTTILQELLNPVAPDPEASGHRRTPHKALVESAKAQIQPLVL